MLFSTAMGANAMADRGDVRSIRINANGGTIGLEHVLEVEAGIRAVLLA
ncbi:hypothetical protein [Rhodovarius crocodyli]|nr:hypothetical protein [Rhodovarius crocodyli]